MREDGKEGRERQKRERRRRTGIEAEVFLICFCKKT